VSIKKQQQNSRNRSAQRNFTHSGREHWDAEANSKEKTLENTNTQDTVTKLRENTALLLEQIKDVQELFESTSLEEPEGLKELWAETILVSDSIQNKEEENKAEKTARLSALYTYLLGREHYKQRAELYSRTLQKELDTIVEENMKIENLHSEKETYKIMYQTCMQSSFSRIGGGEEENQTRHVLLRSPYAELRKIKEHNLYMSAFCIHEAGKQYNKGRNAVYLMPWNLGEAFIGPDRETNEILPLHILHNSETVQTALQLQEEAKVEKPNRKKYMYYHKIAAKL